MKHFIRNSFLFTCIAISFLSCNNSEKDKFQKLNKLPWNTVFSDDCTEDWTKNWTLDGLKAKVKNSSEGMSFYAGPNAFQDSSNTVLWTKKNFHGDLKIEYQYTKLDTLSKFVNIIYIQATGLGEKTYKKDISLWADKRKEPAMRTYYNNMNTLHISYAAYENDNNNPEEDYIRVRRYMPKLKQGLKGTEIEGAYFKTNFFKTGVKHNIVIIKKGDALLMKISNKEQEAFYQWDLSQLPNVSSGKIGLRHMHQRASRYKNIVISQLY